MGGSHRCSGMLGDLGWGLHKTRRKLCLERTPASTRKGTRLQEVSSKDGNIVSQTLKDIYPTAPCAVCFLHRTAGWPAGRWRGRALVGSRDPPGAPEEESVPQHLTQQPAMGLAFTLYLLGPQFPSR